MKNAPIAEIVAELRWGNGRTGQPPAISFGGSDTIYVRLGIALGRLKYDKLERVLPEGVPVQAGQVVYRYRNDETLQNTLYQAGIGVFTANGLPPYSSWREFETVVRSGIGVFLETVPPQELGPVELILRYIDAFTKEHLGDIELHSAPSIIAGVSYEPVKAVSDFVGNIPPTIKFSAVHQAQSGASVVLEIGNGRKDAQDAIVMNTIASSPPLENVNLDSVMEGFNNLQHVLHDMFDQMINREPKLKEHLQGA